MKTLVTIIALSAATIFSAQAQTNQKTATKAVKEQPAQTTDYAKTHTDRMTRDLNLSAEQSKRLMETNKRYYSEAARMNKETVKDADRQAMMKKSNDAYDAELKKILDNEQYEKYSTMKDDYMKDMKSSHMDKAPANKDMQREEMSK